MGAIGSLCVFGVLILFADAGAPHYTNYDLYNDFDDDCQHVTLTSNPWTPGKKIFTDYEGNPVQITRVKVIDQISIEQCVQDSTFFIQDSKLIVKNGCSAKFKVCFTNPNYGTNNNYPVTPGCKIVRLLSRLNREARKFLHKEVTSIRVVQQFQDGVPCQKRVNFGHIGRKVYATGGCRADFEVCFDYRSYPGHHGGSHHYPGGSDCQKVVLESWGRHEPATKSFGRFIQYVDLVKQHSSAPCIQGSTYFLERHSLIVKDGCQGVFNVCF